MIVDAAHFSDGEFEEDIDGAAASCREHKILIVIFVFIKNHHQTSCPYYIVKLS